MRHSMRDSSDDELVQVLIVAQSVIIGALVVVSGALILSALLS